MIDLNIAEFNVSDLKKFLNNEPNNQLSDYFDRLSPDM